jgi:hypothetical protein
MGFQALLGRSLFALIFLSSALNKVHTFGDDGGPTALYMAPKLDSFKVTPRVATAAPRGRAARTPVQAARVHNLRCAVHASASAPPASA